MHNQSVPTIPSMFPPGSQFQRRKSVVVPGAPCCHLAHIRIDKTAGVKYTRYQEAKSGSRATRADQAQTRGLPHKLCSIPRFGKTK
jgi:hypothetical protein